MSSLRSMPPILMFFTCSEPDTSTLPSTINSSGFDRTSLTSPSGPNSMVAFGDFKRSPPVLSLGGAGFVVAGFFVGNFFVGGFFVGDFFVVGGVVVGAGFVVGDFFVVGGVVVGDFFVGAGFFVPM